MMHTTILDLDYNSESDIKNVTKEVANLLQDNWEFMTSHIYCITHDVFDGRRVKGSVNTRFMAMFKRNKV